MWWRDSVSSCRAPPTIAIDFLFYGMRPTSRGAYFEMGKLCTREKWVPNQSCGVCEGDRQVPRRLIVASNREPFSHERQQGRILCRQPAGGLTAALGPLLRCWGGVWVAQGSGEADRDVVDRDSCVMVPPGNPSYKLRRVWLADRLWRQYYCGLAN